MTNLFEYTRAIPVLIGVLCLSVIGLMKTNVKCNYEDYININPKKIWIEHMGDAKIKEY